MVREIDADRETPKEVQARIKTMLTFLTSLMTWFDQIVQLPKGTLVALMKLGAKVGALVPKPVPLVVSFWALDASRMRAEGLTASAATLSLVVGGVLGFVGLVRSYRTAPEAGPGGIELTIVFLLAGIAPRSLRSPASRPRSAVKLRWRRSRSPRPASPSRSRS